MYDPPNAEIVQRDIAEILKMSDHMLVLEQGKILREGIPAEIFTHKEVSGKFQFSVGYTRDY